MLKDIKWVLEIVTATYELGFRNNHYLLLRFFRAVVIEAMHGPGFSGQSGEAREDSIPDSDSHTTARVGGLVQVDYR